MSIPKKIHYCWFGGQQFPPLVDKCMATWGDKLHDWEIVRWDESNSYLDNEYVKNALDKKQYAFAADYMRFRALYEHGGVYLDTDIEIVKSLNDLCNLDAFASPENLAGTRINVAVLGAEKGHPLIKEVIDYYDNYSGDFKIVPEIFTSILHSSEHDISVLSRECFYPYNPYDEEQPVKQMLLSDITPNTYAIHHWFKSWNIPKIKRTFRERMINSIRKRSRLFAN